MAKLVRLNRAYWTLEDVAFWCPGCHSGHEVAVSMKNSSGAQWTFNGDHRHPTFSPSLVIKINPPGHQHYQPDVHSSVCHSFVRDGKIQFLGDCTHALAGQTVDLPDIPDGKYITCERLE